MLSKSLRGEPMRYIAGESRLEIYAPDAVSVDVARVDGQRVMSSSARAVDFSGLRPGVYVVRLVTAGAVFQTKVFKR